MSRFVIGLLDLNQRIIGASSHLLGTGAQLSRRRGHLVYLILLLLDTRSGLGCYCRGFFGGGSKLIRAVEDPLDKVS